MKITPGKSVLLFIVGALLAGLVSLCSSGCVTAGGTPAANQASLELAIGVASDAAALEKVKQSIDDTLALYEVLGT